MKKKRKRPYDLYADPSEDPDLDWLVKGVVTLASLLGAVVAGIAGGAAWLVCSLVGGGAKRPSGQDKV